MITWPATLQQKLNEQGFSRQKGETNIRTEMEFGPQKVRKRTTTAIDTYSCTIDLELDNYLILENFYDTTLNSGVEYFEFDHPITGVATEFRFTGPYSETPMGGRWFKVTMQWEVRP